MKRCARRRRRELCWSRKGSAPWQYLRAGPRSDRFPAGLGALLLALLDSAASEGAVDFLWLSAGPGEGEPAVSHAFADAQHPRLFLNAGKLTPSELWEEAQTHCRLGPAALPYRAVRLPAPLASKHFTGGYALSREGEERGLPFPGTA